MVAPLAVASDVEQVKHPAKEIPLTTNSEEARRRFRGGLENLENQQTHRAHVDFRAAVRADGDFALAHLFLAYDNGNPVEEQAELEKARALARNASEPEQQMVQWMAGWRDGEMVPAISAMNDLIAEYSDDKFLLFIAGRWMVQQKNYEAAQRMLERAVALDPNYPAALNELGYAYAGNHNFERAFASLDKYVKALPGEPNTEDSYGEISRMSGRYEQALAHYNQALSYDSTFLWSQVGLADTHMLMGKEEQAREEYATAVAAATSQGDRLTWEISSALTYAYQNDAESFFHAMQKVADEAHALHVGVQEATAYRLMAMYSQDAKDVMEYGRKAEEVISNTTEIAPTDSDQQLALVLRTEAIHSALAGNLGSAKEALQELEMLALNSRSQFVQFCSEGAQGGVLWAQKKYAEAIPHLEEDQSNPLSAVRLAEAYRETGDRHRAEQLAGDLIHEPTMDDLMARRMLNESHVRTAGK